MAKNNKKADKKSEETVVEEPQINNEENTVENEETKEEPKEELSAEEKLQAEVSESKDKYLRLYSEFENFRRRTSKEKLELISSANESLLQALLPVLDDFERAEQSITEEADIKSVKEGVDLIYNKFKSILEQKGIKKIEADKGSEFDVEYHEAITQIPAPEESLKGKIVDVVEKGYQLNDKVIRFAKVVTGA
ncbi:nucleotide exchange factor GrpE [Reichenbachiella carrageenanivorans]|uniref:Protein GrpE n=1 Tax=Reichenbachiella carrageenanivorans TaxID=2979869 RepID=A0ABY6D274_9BACT|nr:nucleotide exchange factor GrpE [Reichenbachiella carrageenanivorans]UXX80262.1 nucleotide exchange factor GrpE [Reichenbachiella carrageenanivorans]